MVTDGLSSKYPLRIRDFPPDETALFGIGIGYAQSGLLPIVEMPYAKYLDCGADMFFEAIIMNWLSAGKQPNGVMLRLQGFGNGLFGGNFHTHNALHIPPGLDVVCYSNGADYVNGWRYSIQQCRAGRIVMSVDCTQQINNRHCYGEQEKDGLLMTNIPGYREYLTFNDVAVYNQDRHKFILYDQAESVETRSLESESKQHRYLEVDKLENLQSLWTNTKKKEKKEGLNVVVITYGLGVNAARQAQHQLLASPDGSSDIADILVVDTPYLSDVPKQLTTLLSRHHQEIDGVVFADICKEGQNPLNGIIAKLQQHGILQLFSWLSVAAQFTYNPLGKDLTFLSKDDVVECIQEMARNHRKEKKL